MKKIIFMLAVLVVAGCGSKPKPDPAVVACPEKTIRMIQANNLIMKDIKAGETPESALSGLQGLRQKTVLERDGETMNILFYQTNLPLCPWLGGEESLTPVVVEGGTVMAVGTQQVKDLTAKGWVIKDAAWPWQRYDFGYLPRK